MSARTYRVTIDIARDDELGDRATVTVAGNRFRYPWHWEDNLRSLARRAVWENFYVERIESVTEDRDRGGRIGGSFLVAAVTA